MNGIKLRDYQQESHNQVIKNLEKNNKILCVLPTGAGKSINIGYLANGLEGRSLVLTHRDEIWRQNSKWIKDLGQLNAKTNTTNPHSKTVIAMAQTLHARIQKYGKDYIGGFDNIILDEVHVDIFKKVYELYDFKRLIGYTATPITGKVERMTDKQTGQEYTRPLTLSRDFDVLVQTISEQDLIDMGYLTQDFNVVLQLPNMDKLKDSATHPDGYTSQSINEVYSNTAAFNILYEGYEKYAKGKKTMIFNSTTRVNANLYAYLKEKGLNVRLYDSVNSQKENRKDVIEWFRNERDAVLINANVFTTGFDVTDVEVIMVNRATKSLSLWLQMVGRGSRITDKIYKDQFTVIDLGMNIALHGRWSLKRDWNEYFLPQDWRKRNKSDMLNTWECHECGSYNFAGEVMTDDGLACAFCGELKKNNKQTKKDKDGNLIEIDKVMPPRGRDIVAYAKANGLNNTGAFKVLANRCLQMYDFVDKDYFIKNKYWLLTKTAKLWLPCYFAIINSDLGGANKKLKTEGRKMQGQILKKYGL
jgi:superfamily II DNA or RNA helicase